MAKRDPRAKECYVDLSIGTNEFNRVIVYLPRSARSDGTFTSYQGEFKCFHLSLVISETKLDDFHLEDNVFVNEYGTVVKPIEVTTNKIDYHQAYLFARVRKLASKFHTLNIERYLNAYLGRYKDNLREGIAQEWCGQEIFRILPHKQDHCIQPAEVDVNGRTTLYTVPDVPIRDLLKDLLPNGWDDETPV